MKVTDVQLRHYKETDNYIFILGNTKLLMQCDKCGKEKEVMCIGGYLHKGGVEHG